MPVFHVIREKESCQSEFWIAADLPLMLWEQSILRNISIVLRLFNADGVGVESRVVELLRDFELLLLVLRPVNSLSRGV